MWKLKKIQAKNLCAFKTLQYDLQQRHTTLIFGNNMDNDSQGSNGSGKSAMLEAIAIGLTGEPLRKIKMDEIINDAEEEASVSLLLYNDVINQHLSIERVISRKNPQAIKINVFTGDDDDNKESVEQASVGDYNKYILDTLGLTKDDLFSNFILSKHKYTSFLSSSDRDKKEIINRFSNGSMVDESIAALQADMVPIEEALKKAENNVANCNGRVEALREQINTAITESTERSQKKAERIKNWQESIATKRMYIREQEAAIRQSNQVLDSLDELDKTLQQLEESSKNVSECNAIISEKFTGLYLEQPKDFAAVSEKNRKELDKITADYARVQKEIAQCQKKHDSALNAQEELKARDIQLQTEFNKKSKEIASEIQNLIGMIRQLEDKNDILKRQRSSLEADIAMMHKQLAGVIECPKCKYEFTLGGNVDIADTRRNVEARENEVKELLSTVKNNQQKIEDYTSQGREMRKSQNELDESKATWAGNLTKAYTEVQNWARELSSLNYRLQSLDSQIISLKKEIENARRNLFDESFEILDEAIKYQENRIKQAELDINNANGAIQSYEESIRDIENSSETDVIETLKASMAKYEKELGVAMCEYESIERDLQKYKIQENTFVEFKTYLANTKIDALSHITNEFLEAIGSDIRIAFSGYTVLKSGKIRDKISISLLRDGVDCGSFDKFSEGEKARVALANILAMHKLTNLNCNEDKGLDLLVLDEILDATDEQGLTNIFHALNQLQITALVVTHIGIAENYPYKVVINKLNGVSYIND